MKHLIIFISAFISLAVSTIAHPVSNKHCAESPRPFLDIFPIIRPPKATEISADIEEFCRSDPHGFVSSGASYDTPKRSPSCYRSVDDEVVLEIPDVYFNECRNDAYYESRLEYYSYRWVSFNSDPFKLVIYNKKHKYIRRAEYVVGSEVFQRVADYKLYMEKLTFIVEKLRSKEYSREVLGCLGKPTDTKGNACPEELLQSFPESVSMQAPWWHK